MRDESSPVCILTFSYPRYEDDEASVFIKRLVDAFAQGGLSGILIVPLDQTEPMTVMNGDIEILRYRYGIFTRGQLAFGAGIMPNLRANLLLAFQIPGLLLGMILKALKNARRFRVVHANWVVSAIPAFVIKLLTGKPYIVTLRGEDARLIRKKSLKPLLYFPIRSASAVTSVNESFLEIAGSVYGVKSDRLHTIPNGVALKMPTDKEIRVFCEENLLKQDQSYLLFTGTQIPRKRVDTLIEALASPKLSNYELLLVGRTTDQEYFNQLVSLIATKNLSNRVHLVGAKPPDEIPYYLSLASFYLSASEFEGRSNSMLEAFAAGVPVIASDITEHKEVISEGKTGFLFKLGDSNSLVESILRAESQPQLLEEITMQAQRGANKFSWEHTTAQYRQLFVNIT